MASANHMSRRSVLRGAVVGGAFAVSAPLINRGIYQVFAEPGATYSKHVVDLVQESLAIDMLGLIALSDETQQKWFLTPDGFTEQDFESFKVSGINVFHHSVGIGGPDAYQDCLEYMSVLNGFVAAYPQYFIRVDAVEDMGRARSEGKIGLVMGLQNSAHFRSPEDVDLFRSMGQMVSQLTYNDRNMIGDGCTERVDAGITDFGVSIIERMNEVGMLIDVSHCGERTTLDAFELSKKPVSITHSNCRSLNEHPRLKSDEAIVRMAATGGVMGVSAVRMFVRDREPTTVEHVVDHIDHVVKLVGIDHVGVGTDSDMWGYDDLPPAEYKALKSGYKGSYAFREKIDIDEMGHPKKLYDLTDALLRRGYGDENIRAILGGNFKRMLAEVWT